MHRVPYHKINYHLSVDHTLHNVTYIGLAKSLATMPEHIRYKGIVRPGVGGVADEVIAAVREHKLNIDLLVSMSESDELDAAKVREALGITGRRVNDVVKLRDKLHMKQLVARNGISVPRAMSLSEFKRTMQIGWIGKTVLKPIDPEPSADIKIFDGPEILRQALRARKTGVARLDRPEQELDQFDVEEYIAGDVVHFDGLIKHGRIIAMLGTTCIGDEFSYVAGQPFGSVQFELSEEDEGWVQKVIHATNLEHGAFHLEAVNEKTGKVFLDIANRPGGACVTEAFRLATGINLVTAELRILTGDKIKIKQRKKSRKFGWFIFPGHHLPPGTCRISGHQRYLDHPALVRYDMLCKSKPVSCAITYQSNEVPLAGIICGSSSEEMGNWLRRMFRDVKIEPTEIRTESSP